MCDYRCIGTWSIRWYVMVTSVITGRTSTRVVLNKAVRNVWHGLFLQVLLTWRCSIAMETSIMYLLTHLCSYSCHIITTSPHMSSTCHNRFGCLVGNHFLFFMNTWWSFGWRRLFSYWRWTTIDDMLVEKEYVFTFSYRHAFNEL